MGKLEADGKLKRMNENLNFIQKDSILLKHKYNNHNIHISRIYQKMLNEDKKMETLNYRILLRKEPEGGYTVIVPSLPGCITYGNTIEEGIEMAKEAIELYIESLIAHGEEIPTEEHTLEYSLSLKPLNAYA